MFLSGQLRHSQSVPPELRMSFEENWHTFTNIADKLEHMARSSSASGLSFVLPDDWGGSGGDDQFPPPAPEEPPEPDFAPVPVITPPGLTEEDVIDLYRRLGKKEITPEEYEVKIKLSSAEAQEIAKLLREIHNIRKKVLSKERLGIFTQAEIDTIEKKKERIRAIRIAAQAKQVEEIVAREKAKGENEK